jgi:polysaccharide biosynthesis protein PslJ
MCVWLAALLIDPRVRFQRSAIDGPLIAVFTVSALSIAANVAAITDDGLTSDATKQLTFLASFLALFFLLSGLMRRRVDVDLLLALLVLGGCVVSLFSLVELRTGLNVFNHLELALPFLQQTQDSVVAARGGYVRVVASSQHPIALGAMFVLLIPLALYLYKAKGKRLWLIAAAVLALGTMATGSRTAIVMMLALATVYLILRTRETIRFWPAVIPLMIVIHFAMPGVMGSLYKSFFPQGGLIAEQADAGVGSSRVTSFGPALERVGQHPILGSGFGARSFHGEDANSFIVDDQWLSTAMETGILGLLAWLWLFVRFLRRSFGRARRDAGADGWFYTAMSASVLAFAVGMLTYDAFSFIQSTLILFVILGLGCARMNEAKHDAAPAT